MPLKLVEFTNRTLIVRVDEADNIPARQRHGVANPAPLPPPLEMADHLEPRLVDRQVANQLSRPVVPIRGNNDLEVVVLVPKKFAYLTDRDGNRCDFVIGRYNHADK